MIFIINKEGYYFESYLDMSDIDVDILIEEGCTICNEEVAKKLTGLDDDEFEPMVLHYGEDGEMLLEMFGFQNSLITNPTKEILDMQI